MKNSLIITGLLLFSMNVIAGYVPWREGFYVNLNGDTIRGEIDIFYNDKNCSFKFQYKAKGAAEPTVLKAEEATVVAYGKDVYEVVDIPRYGSTRKGMVMRLVTGTVTLFRQETYDYASVGYSWYSGNTWGTSSKVPGTVFYVTKGDNVLKVVPDKKFAQAMSEFFSDNASLSKRIADKELMIGDLENIVKEYNGQR